MYRVADSTERPELFRKSAIYGGHFVVVFPIQIAHLVLLAQNSEDNARWILPCVAAAVTAMPTVFIGYTLLECGGFEQSLRRNELSTRFVFDYFAYMLPTCLCQIWLAIAERKTVVVGKFDLLDRFGVFLVGQISFLLVMFVNFMQWSYHRSLYVECLRKDYNFQELRRLRELTAFLVVYVIFYTAGVHAIAFSYLHPHPIRRYIGMVLAPFYVLVPVYRIGRVVYWCKEQVRELEGRLEGGVDGYKAALGAMHENVMFEVRLFEN